MLRIWDSATEFEVRKEAQRRSVNYVALCGQSGRIEHGLAQKGTRRQLSARVKVYDKNRKEVFLVPLIEVRFSVRFVSFSRNGLYLAADCGA